MGFLDSQSATATGSGGVGESVWASGFTEGTPFGGNHPDNLLFTDLEVIGIDVTLGAANQRGKSGIAYPTFFYLTKTGVLGATLGGTDQLGKGGGMVAGTSDNIPSGTTYYNGMPTWNFWDALDKGENTGPTWQLRYGSGVGPGTESVLPYWVMGASGKHSSDHPVGNMGDGGGQNGRWELVNKGQVVAVAANTAVNPLYTNQGTANTTTYINPYSGGSNERTWIVNTGATVYVTGSSYVASTSSFALTAVTGIPNNAPVNRIETTYS